MAPVYNPQNAPVFFVGVKGDVTIKDQAGNDIKLKKGDKIPADARIIVGDGGQIVFKQANKTLKYESQGEASLSNALTESSDATLDPGIKNLVEAAEQITTTPDSSSEATPAQQPLAKPVARSDASMPSPTSAKQGISEPPEIVHADRGENPQPDATEIVTKMAEEVATRSDAIRASTTETEDLLPSAGETVAFEHSHEPVAPDETPLPPAAPDITSFAPNTGSGDDNITLEKELTISGSAPAGTHVILLCDGAVIKEGIQVSSQGQWSTRWNTGKDGSFTLTATASSGSGTSAPSSAFTVEVDSRAPALEFDNPASDDNYNFVTYNKAAVITGTATPGLTFTLTQGDNHWEVTADDKGTWSQAVANLNDGLTEFSASSVSVAGVEVHKTAKLLVQSTPYDFKIQPDTGISDSDTITSSEDLLLTVKSQPDATVVLTILGIDVKSTVNKDGLAEFPITLAGDNAYTCQLKTIYTNNEGESDTVEETITLDTTPAIISLDPLQSIYKDPDVSFTGQCDENGSTVSIKLVNVFKPGISVSTTATVENGVFKATATVPEQGQYRAEVSAVDVAGNASNPQDYTFEYQPLQPELIIQNRPDDSSTNANPEWTGTFPHEGKLEISFAGKTDTITVQDDDTWSYQFSEVFDFGRHTVTFTGTQTGLPGTAIEQDSFTVAMPDMQLTIDEAPGERTNLILTEWKGSGAAPNAKVTLTLATTKGDLVEQTVDADDQGFFTIALKLIEGSYSTTLTATASGYQDASLAGSNVTVDRTGPVLQVDPGFKPTAGTCTMTGTATDHLGKPEPVGSVVVKLDSGQSYPGSIKGGHFSVELINLAPNHTYNAEITGSDDLSNAGTTQLEVLSIPPLPVTALQFSKEPDSLTNNDTLEWEGKTTPGATIDLIIKTPSGNYVSKDVTADTSGFFALSEKVTEGSHTVRFMASAPGHKANILPDKDITVDHTGPELTIDPGFQLTAGTCTLTGKALDQDGHPEPKGSVTVQVPAIQQSFTGTISNGIFNVQIDGLKHAQTYKLSLSATDELKNTGQPLDTSYTTPSQPVTNLQFSEEPDSLTSKDTLQWKGSATADATVTLTLTPATGQPVTNQVKADSKGLFTISEPVNEGQYTASFTASAPGYQDKQLPDTAITVDHTGPELTIDPGFQLTAGTCTLTGKALDQDGHPEPKGSVNVQVPAIQQSFTGTISNGIFNVQIDGLKHAQTYKLSLSATDELKNTGQPLDTSYTTPSQPVTNLQFSEEPDSLTSKDTLQWKGSATADATVTLTLTPATGQPVTNQVKADSKGLFTISEPVNEGQYTASFTASAPGYQDKQLPDTAITVDQTGPELTIDPGFQLTAGTCTLTGKALDQDGHPEPKGSVTVQVPAIQQSFTGTISNGIFNVQIDGLKHAQTYKLSLSATDELKNTGQPLDTSYTTPSQPVTNLQFSEEPDSLTSKDTLQWKGSATADATVTLTLTPATGQPVTNQVKADSKGLFTISEPVNEGQYTASFTASAPGYQDKQLPDTAITVDHTGPELTIDPGFQLTAGTCTLTGKALDQDGHPEPKGSVTVQVPGIQKPFTGIISNGIFSVQIDSLKPGQTYQLHLSATDVLKNTSFLDESYTTPDTYDFAVTSALNTDTKSIVLKGTHPLPRGRVQLKLTGDHVNTIDKNNGIITGRAKNHEWSLEINNLLLKQEVKVNLYAMDDAAKALDAKLLSNVPELQENLIVDGDRDSNIGNLKALSGAGVYGHHIVMYAAKCSGKCNDKDGLTPWKVELTSPVQPNAKVHVTLDSDIVTIKGKTRKVQDRPYIKTIKLDASGKAILEQPLDYTKKGNLKIDLSSEHMKLATIRFKAEGLEHNEEVFIGVETPSLHYTFDNIRPGQDTLVSQTYPAQAKISGSINQVQGSLGSGLQLGKGALQIQDFKDLFNDSYTICFDIKTSAKASTGNQLFPSLAGYYDETSNTGAKTHLFGAFNEKGQIGIADHNSGLFAEPVVADGQWHSVCISRTLVDQSTSTYRMLIDGKQSDISKDGSSVTGKEAQSIHGMILGSPVSEYPVELLGGVTKSNSPDQVEYLDAVLDNFTAYPIKMETPYESLAYAHVHWGCPNPGPCYYKDEFPAGLMINNIMETRLTPHCSLYLQLKPDASKNSLGTSFTVRYKGTDLDPLDKSVAGDVNVYKLDHVSAENLATLTVKPADPEATHKFELHFDRTVSDLVRVTGKDVSMPDGIIKFDSSASPLGSGISFGVGKEQSYSPSEGDPNCILEDRHLVTEPGTVINGYDIKYYSIIDLNGLREELKTLTQESDMSGKLLKLMSEGSAQQGTENQVQLQDPCKIKDPDCTNDPLVTINTVDNNPAIALSLDGQITYYQHT